MGLMYLFVSVLAESAANTIDKLNFNRNRITAQQLLFLSFLGMTLATLAYVVVTKQPFPRLTFVSLGLLALATVVSFGANVFDYLSLKADDISLREPLFDFEPVIAGLVGYALFPAERKTGFLLAFLIGGVIVYWGSHRRRLGKRQKRGMLYMLLAVSLFGLLPSVYKLSLGYLSPVYITLLRTSAILVLASVFFPMANVRRLSAKKINYSLLGGVVYALAAVASLYAISRLGVVLTMLLSLLGPALRYLAGYFVLKENVRTGEIISSTLLALVVLVPVIK
jgi:drug/metabolite transporter (DMT)-like permease